MSFHLEDLGSSIAEQFARVVRQVPDACAILDQDASWTYAELDEQSDRLAAAVLDTDSADHGPVLLLFDRVPRAIVAMLACIKIGRPYVPLSPSNPQARIHHIRDDSGGTLLLTETSCGALAREISSSSLPVLDTQAVSATDVALGPVQAIPADAPVWILYTSGSTGLPKGVVQTHRNILHYVLNYTGGLELSSDDRIALLFSTTSNAANHEIFSALLNGAMICPFDIRQHGISTLAEWLEQTEITICSCVPTLFRSFVENLSVAHSFPSLRYIKLVGEPVYQRDLEAFRAHFTDVCSFINRLGSTETGTIRWSFADTRTKVDGVNVPVGFPVPGNEISLLDDAGHPIPIGEAGEIVVQSRYLSPGYWRRPDLTKKVFFGEGDHRCYRTGDVGLMLPEGCLVHLGRQDTQIKVRGYRIEAGEIEAALLGHPSVKDVIVIAREDRPDDLRLIAYYTVEQIQAAPTVSELRRHLAGRLPDYMVPNAFVLLLKFPLAPNGKIDRSALPPLGTKRPRLDTTYVAPVTPIEKEIASLWKKLLHLEAVGIHDSFFELGGHSLLATQLLMQIQDVFGIALGLRLLFDSPSIKALAEHVLEKMMAVNEETSTRGDTQNMKRPRELRGNG